MTINTLLMVLALAVGAGTAQSINRDSTPAPQSRPNPKIQGNCYINGIWYNPCPTEYPPPRPEPEPTPISQF